MTFNKFVKITLLITATLFVSLWHVFFVAGLYWPGEIPPFSLSSLNLSFPVSFWVMFLHYAMAAYLEEVIFRFLPIEYMLIINTSKLRFVLGVVVVSAFFGYMHKLGALSIPLQGMSGLFLCTEYLLAKHITKSANTSLIITTITHAFVNIAIFAFDLP